MYDDIWTAGKCMYKLEPIVADGGKLIIYAPHITEISYTHGKMLDEIGYHTRDYFLKQWDKFKHYPARRAGPLHARQGHRHVSRTASKSRESTSFWPPESRKTRCDKINLGYMDPMRFKSRITRTARRRRSLRAPRRRNAAPTVKRIHPQHPEGITEPCNNQCYRYHKRRT